MANTIYAMEAANIFCGALQPDRSNHLTVQNVQLPQLEENFADHAAGGSPVAIQINTHINLLEVTFALIGLNPHVSKLIGESRRENQTFWIYGLIRDRRTGRAINSMARVEGRLGRAAPTQWSKGDNMATEYRIGGIVSYRFTLGDDILYDWDFFTSTFMVGGVDLNEDLNRALQIPAAGIGNGPSILAGS